MTRFPWFLLAGVLFILVSLVALPPIDGSREDEPFTIADPAGLRVFMLGAGGASVAIEAGLQFNRLHLTRLVQRARNALGPRAIAVLAVAASDWGSNFSEEDPSQPAPPLSGPREIFVVAAAGSLLEVRRSTGLAKRVDSSSVRSIHVVGPPVSPKPALRIELHPVEGGMTAGRRLDFYCLDTQRGVRQVTDREQLKQLASDLAGAMGRTAGRNEAGDAPSHEV